MMYNARPSGLDPAHAFFEGCGTAVYLASGDAQFVDCLHTNGRSFPHGLGFESATCDVDFFANGGKEQPGCAKMDIVRVMKHMTAGHHHMNNARLLESVADLVICSHMRAADYFAEAVGNENCTFCGYSAPNDSSTGPSAAHLCLPMGMDTPAFSARGSYYITTAALEPYCISESKADVNSMVADDDR